MFLHWQQRDHLGRELHRNVFVLDPADNHCQKISMVSGHDNWIHFRFEDESRPAMLSTHDPWLLNGTHALCFTNTTIKDLAHGNDSVSRD